MGTASDIHNQSTHGYPRNPMHQAEHGDTRGRPNPNRQWLFRHVGHLKSERDADSKRIETRLTIEEFVNQRPVVPGILGL